MNKKIVISIAIVVLAVVCATMLVACVPSDPTKAKANMEKAGYTVVMTQSQNDSEVSAVLVCTKGGALDLLQGNVEIVTATYYNSSKAAKNAYNDAKAKAEKNGTNFTAKLSGKCVYDGTAQAMKDFN